MSAYRKWLAYGTLGVLAAGLGWMWVWGWEKRAERDVTRPKPYPKGWGEG